MEVRCIFYVRDGTLDFFTDPYTCNVKSVPKDSVETEIGSFKGKHEAGKTNSDVEWLAFFNKAIGFMPRNLKTIFPNLTHLTIQNCGIEDISREDLKGLEDIEYIDLSKNKLRSLPDDLFADMKKLRWVFFHANRLERICSKLLQPLAHTLVYLDFRGNKRINEKFDTKKEGKSDLAKFMEIIDSNCLPPGSQADRMLEEFAKFRSSGEFTDFTIKVREKEFKIHKMVFAAQSSVFKRTFMDNVEEVTFDEIKNCSDGTFEQFLDYFYTGKLETACRVNEVFELASACDVPDLKIICKARIQANLDESNAVQVFNLAHRHASDELKRKSFEVIKKMFPEMDATFENKLDEVNDLVVLKTRMDAILKKRRLE